MNTLAHIFDGGSGRPLSPMAERIARYLMDHPNTIHNRDSLAEACGFASSSRSSDTYVSEIRKALGKLDRIITMPRNGYGWMGDPVPLISVVKECIHTPKNDEMARYAVLTRAEVAKRLGLSRSAVGLIERKALAKLRKKPELKRAFADLVTERQRVKFDPFHEIWLFSVQERIVQGNIDREREEHEEL